MRQGVDMAKLPQGKDPARLVRPAGKNTCRPAKLAVKPPVMRAPVQVRQCQEPKRQQ